MGKKIKNEREDVEEMIREEIKKKKYYLNQKSQREVIMFGKEREKIWKIVKEKIRKIVKEEDLKKKEEKIEGFDEGEGKVLLYEEKRVVKGIKENLKIYEDNLKVWQEKQGGMEKNEVWEEIENEGIGERIKNYNKMIEEEVEKKWDVKRNWKIREKMKFG